MARGEMTQEGEPDRKFYCEYDLAAARQAHQSRIPASHQKSALDKLHRWYDDKPSPEAGGILVLPTGGGKTFTAIRFLCRKPLSDGYKVLWLAHTHHLLEQAFVALADEVGEISEPHRSLKVRVVSGTPGHFPIHRIEPGDNVVIATLQTICRAHREKHKALEGFLHEAGGKLFVVFDEAHHSPAPSYRRFITDLRKSFAKMYLLGLTATPTYTDESKKGWLKKLFPQGILYQEKPERLMAAGILAKPICEEPRTNITPDFNEREYQQWIGTYRDLPENVIDQLARNKERNLFIANTYCHNKNKYGKTIIFADRWHQCEQISEFLRGRGIKTGTVYSHVDADPGSAEARNKRTADENTKTLAAFRADQIDVLLNVRMLTEGTDVPKVNSVFLTRQTTSAILLTQMVGRALRGPKFGGTEEAFIVSFIDNWKQLINWAGYDQLAEGLADANIPEYGKRPPLLLISIEMIQRLARQMDSGINMTEGTFLSLLPIGWYRIQYNTQIANTDEQESVRQLIMVFDKDQDAFGKLIKHLLNEKLETLERENIRLEEVNEQVIKWRDRFFPEPEQHFGTSLEQDIFAIARHIAQNGIAPVFFMWEEKDKHDLDALAQEHIDEDWGPAKCDQALRMAYNREDRLWTSLYYTYPLFKSQYDACVNRLLDAKMRGASPTEPCPPPGTKGEVYFPTEISEEIKGQVFDRDGKVCLCCGCSNRRFLQVDHISPVYHGGSNVLDNFQTLCKTCNLEKGTKTINFRDTQTDLISPPASFPELRPPSGDQAGDPQAWEQFLRRTLNFFYKCGAVHRVTIGKRGKYFHDWLIELRPGHNLEWLEPYKDALGQRIRNEKEKAGLIGPKGITIRTPD